jgi:hypothetical protein
MLVNPHRDILLYMDIVTDIYNEGVDTNSEENVVEVESTAIETAPLADPTIALSDRELLVAVYRQQEQLGNQLNWLCENLAGVFGVVTAMSQNGGGVRGLMKVMKEMNQNG